MKTVKIRIQRPQTYANSRFSHDAAQITKLPFCQQLVYQHLLHAIVQCACNVKAKYNVNSSKDVVEVDRPMYALS